MYPISTCVWTLQDNRLFVHLYSWSHIRGDDIRGSVEAEGPKERKGRERNYISLTKETMPRDLDRHCIFTPQYSSVADQNLYNAACFIIIISVKEWWF
jgi:hypothetical protein